LVSDNFTTQNLAETAKDELQIFVASHGVQFANEQNVLRRLDLCKRQISHHFQSESLRLCLAIATPPFQLFLIDIVICVQCCLVFDSNSLQLLGGRRGT
jgi:hypothetical protein